MTRRFRVFVFATCIAGCGGFLGLSGDDDDDGEPSVPANVDGSLDGQGDEGGSIVPGTGTDAGDSGTKKDASVGNSDAAKDDADAAFDGATSGATFKYVFVTSLDYAGSFASGGETSPGADADILCQARGNASQLSKIKGRTWRAWLSSASPSEAAAQRIVTVTGSLPYRLPEETVVANNRNDLLDGTLLHAIDRDESGVNVVDQPVWTGSTVNGVLGAAHCMNWTSVAGGTVGTVGATGATDGKWTDDVERPCTQLARLYCFEQ